jgi:hypothetical protein
MQKIIQVEDYESNKRSRGTKTKKANKKEQLRNKNYKKNKED